MEGRLNMCGIVGYVGKNDATEKLLSGLKKLEYRGYDSAGVALKTKKDIEIIKAVGRIVNLEMELEGVNIDANMGIAHTRWATHGTVTKENAHPHKVGNVTLVHNGIIENASNLKEELIGEGVTFNSETDTEVIAALLNKYYEKDFVNTINKVYGMLKGSFALAILTSDSDKMYITRKDSPLVFGYNKEEYMASSDIVAIGEYTKDYYVLNDGDVIEISMNGYKAYNKGKEINIKFKEYNDVLGDTDLNGYEHYMLKEIIEEPKVLSNFIKYVNSIKLDEEFEEIHIVACGSAYYAGLVGKYLIEEHSDINVICEVASEYRYRNICYKPNTLLILLSQSGETADTIAAMRKAYNAGVKTLGIVNNENSCIARETDYQIFIKCGVEVAVATTKAYLMQVLSLAVIAEKLNGECNIDEISKLPHLIDKLLSQRDVYKDIAKTLYKHNDVYFIGRKIDYAICLEGSLKLKEVSYIHSEAYQAGELKHGSISLIEKGTPVIAVITDKNIRDKSISNLEEVKSRGAYTICISNIEVKEAKSNIVIPNISEYYIPLLAIIPLQLIAYETALLKGCEIDKPKNLAKSVTVE